MASVHIMRLPTTSGILLLSTLSKMLPCAAATFTFQPSSSSSSVLANRVGMRHVHQVKIGEVSSMASRCTNAKRYASSSSSSSSPSDVVIPRAAVSVVARCQCANQIRYALVQRGKSPNKGIWSFPGGKIESGEGTLQAAMRELWEETRLGAATDLTGSTPSADVIEQSEGVDAVIKWHTDGPITSSDSIHVGDDGVVRWHYVISQYFAHVESSSGPEEAPKMIASDDAADAKWWNVDDIKKGIEEDRVTPGLLRVIKMAEAMYAAGLLECR